MISALLRGGKRRLDAPSQFVATTPSSGVALFCEKFDHQESDVIEARIHGLRRRGFDVRCLVVVCVGRHVCDRCGTQVRDNVSHTRTSR